MTRCTFCDRESVGTNVDALGRDPVPACMTHATYFHCEGCGRREEDCSEDPCDEVIEDRGEDAEWLADALNGRR